MSGDKKTVNPEVGESGDSEGRSDHAGDGNCELASTVVGSPVTVAAPRATLRLSAGRAKALDSFTAKSNGAGGQIPQRGSASQPVPLQRLTAGRKELKIEHAGETYLLRVTKSNKLILTKHQDATAPSQSEACSPA